MIELHSFISLNPFVIFTYIISSNFLELTFSRCRNISYSKDISLELRKLIFEFHFTLCLIP